MQRRSTLSEPVLVRVDHPRPWGDIVDERRLPVDFRLAFREGEPMRIERVSGDRGALVEELRRAGLRVLSDDDPLAIAHREIKRAHYAKTGKLKRQETQDDLLDCLEYLAAFPLYYHEPERVDKPEGYAIYNAFLQEQQRNSRRRGGVIVMR